MGNLDILERCIGLTQTIAESLEHILSTSEESASTDQILSGAQAAVTSIVSNTGSVLNAETHAALRRYAQHLSDAISGFDNSISSREQIARCAESWSTYSKSCLYIEILKDSSSCNQSEEKQEIELLNSIMADQTLPEIQALAYYVFSRKLSVKEPDRAYRLGLQTFEMRPDLGSSITPPGSPVSNYRYHKVEEIHFDCCPICHGEGTPYYCAAAIEMADFSDAFSPLKLWMKCESCGQIYTYNFPKGILQSAAQEDEPTQALCSMSPNATLLPIFGDILSHIQRYTNGKHLLEIGAGGGELIAAALEMDYSIDALEIEKSQALWLSDLLGIPVKGEDFLRYDPQTQYDIITMGDVIEHIPEPIAAIQKAHNLLNDGGVLWISTPNFESAFSRIKKFSDPMWNEPYHISYFSRAGIEKILNENGFSVQEYKISNRYNGSMEIIALKT